jgi:hypothetical protein
MYVTAWLSGTVRLDDGSLCQPNAPCDPHEWTMTWQQGALVGGVLVAVVVAGSLYAFRKRDVT